MPANPENRRTRQIYSVFNQVSDAFAKQSIQLNQSRLNTLLEKFYSPGPSFQYVFDFPNKRFQYLSDEVHNLFGVDPASFRPDDFAERIHPEDINHFIAMQEIAMYFFFDFISKEEIMLYKTSFQFRIKDIEGNYRLFLHQNVVLATDEEHNVSSTLVNHSIIDHITKVNNKKVSFIHIGEGQSFFGISRAEELNGGQSKLTISNREVDILKLVSEGFTSKEIADYLTISIDTVHTHRKNILNKTEFKNLTQAATYYVREGLI